MAKIKHFEADEETHKKAKEDALKLGITLKSYIKMLINKGL